MNYRVNLMVEKDLARKASLYGKLNGGISREVVTELALTQLLATDPRIDEADAVLEAHKAQAWRELEEGWAG